MKRIANEKAVVVVLAPTGKDAALAVSVLENAGVRSEICPCLEALVAELGSRTGAVLIAEEALDPAHVASLTEALANQPTWSDIPVILLTTDGAMALGDSSLRDVLGERVNVMLLERPLRTVTLVSTVQTALRARSRQYQVRDLIEQRETILASIRDAFSAIDREWRYIYVNARAAEFAKMSREEMIGRVVWEIYPEVVGTELYHRMQQAMEDRTADHFEFFHEPWDRWMETRVYPAADGLVIFRAEITDRKNAELELQRAKAAAEDANRAKDQFLAMLSHELRTPLTPVLMTVANLQRDPLLSDEVRRDLDVIHRNVELEALLIDDLLDLTRIAHGKLELRRDAVDIHRLIEHALTISANDLAGKKMRISQNLAAAEHQSWADAARLQQVFWNLIKNAAKFTPAGGHISVSTRNDGAGHIVIEIADNGVGIDAEVMPRIFDAFEQGSRRITSSYGGLGLGLAIAKRVVDLHQGTITAASGGIDRGSTFTLVLDVIATSLLDGHTCFVEAAIDTQPARILLVEDHEDTARMLRRILERAGYVVSSAGTVADGKKAASEARFDLLISDLGLPDGSGLELMRHLRENAPLPSIALSGFGTDDDVAATKAAGFAEHLTKPVDWERLKATIERLIARRTDA